MSLNQHLSSAPVDVLRRDVVFTVKELLARLDAIETQLAALAPLLRDSDRMEIARFCQVTGITLNELDRRDASADRARKMNRVFHAFRQKGWSFDRIAKATG
jgi:phosphoenolpyruvate carboxylase